MIRHHPSETFRSARTLGEVVRASGRHLHRRDGKDGNDEQHAQKGETVPDAQKFRRRRLHGHWRRRSFCRDRARRFPRLAEGWLDPHHQPSSTQECRS